MKLEDQVASLELAKRLKELGVKQESYFEWSCDQDHLTHLFCENLEHFRIWKRDRQYPEGFAAFTVAELAESLPHKIEAGHLFIDKMTNGWMVFYSNPIRDAAPRTSSESLANAMALMLIHLIEKEIVNPELERRS